MARNLMSDVEGASFEPFLAVVRQPNGRKAADHRRVMDGVFWIARTGAPWRDLPEEFGKWGSVYRQFRRWTPAGLWQTILEVLNESETVPDGVQMIDSTIIRARHQAAGAKGETQKEDPGRSKGGLTSRIRLLGDSHDIPMTVALISGQTSDYLGFVELVSARIWFRHLST